LFVITCDHYGVKIGISLIRENNETANVEVCLGMVDQPYCSIHTGYDGCVSHHETLRRQLRTSKPPESTLRHEVYSFQKMQKCVLMSYLISK
jgi:hypothetical protein